jgi:hypothetical protein
MPVKDERKIQLQHPDSSKQMGRISKTKYEMVSKAILDLIPEDEIGFRFKDLAEAVAGSLTPEQLEVLGSVGWYTTSVKLDLEARGLIERFPGKGPQRLVRKG